MMQANFIYMLAVTFLASTTFPMSVRVAKGQPFPDQCYSHAVLDRSCAAQAVKDTESRLQTLVDHISDKLHAGLRDTRNNQDSTQTEWCQQRIRLFREMQHAWRVYRDATCHAAAYEYHGGNFATPGKYACRVEIADTQRSRLQRLYNGGDDDKP